MGVSENDHVKVTGGAYKGSTGVVVMATPKKARVRMTDTGELLFEMLVPELQQVLVTDTLCDPKRSYHLRP